MMYVTLSHDIATRRYRHAPILCYDIVVLRNSFPQNRFYARLAVIGLHTFYFRILVVRVLQLFYNAPEMTLNSESEVTRYSFAVKRTAEDGTGDLDKKKPRLEVIDC